MEKNTLSLDCHTRAEKYVAATGNGSRQATQPAPFFSEIEKGGYSTDALVGKLKSLGKTGDKPGKSRDRGSPGCRPHNPLLLASGLETKKARVMKMGAVLLEFPLKLWVAGRRLLGSGLGKAAGMSNNINRESVKRMGIVTLPYQASGYIRPKILQPIGMLSLDETLAAGLPQGDTSLSSTL